MIGRKTRMLLRHYLEQGLIHPALLVVNEIGNLPVTQSGAVLFSNKGFEEWGRILGDEIMAAALLDWLLHRCHIVNIRGNRYRMLRYAELSKAIHPLAKRETPKHPRRKRVPHDGRTPGPLLSSARLRGIAAEPELYPGRFPCRVTPCGVHARTESRPHRIASEQAPDPRSNVATIRRSSTAKGKQLAAFQAATATPRPSLP